MSFDLEAMVARDWQYIDLVKTGTINPKTQRPDVSDSAIAGVKIHIGATSKKSIFANQLALLTGSLQIEVWSYREEGTYSTTVKQELGRDLRLSDEIVDDDGVSYIVSDAIWSPATNRWSCLVQLKR